MNNDFKKLIHIAKKVELPEDKKSFIRARIEEFVAFTPIKKPITSPLRSPFYISKFSVLHFSKAVSLVLIVLIAGGGTMSYASENTLPGDVFYTVKVDFKEPLEEKLAFSPEAKLEVQTKQVEKRLTEAQVLFQKNDMSPEKHKEVEERVEKQVEKIGEAIDKLQEKGDVETILATTSKLEPVLKAHQEALKEVSQEEVMHESSTPSLMTSSEDVSLKTELSSEAVELSTIESTPSVVVAVSEHTTSTKSIAVDNLLKTVERTLETVEEKETKALETVALLEETDLNTQRITNATDKKVEEVEKEIIQIKNDLDRMETPTVSDETAGNLGDDQNTIAFEQSLKQDAILITVAEAEILLSESKILFEQGLYKESLEKAQEALKLTASIEANKKIEAVKETPSPVSEEVIEVEEEKPISEDQTEETKTTEPKEIEVIKDPVKIEDQASQAIQAVEQSLKPTL